MKIRDIAENDRPRERMAENGSSALSDAELLALIIQKGTKNVNAIELSQRILSEHSLHELSELSLYELQAISGIGEAKATQLLALFELSKRYLKSRQGNGAVIRSAEDVYDLFAFELEDKKKEHFYCVHLNTANEVIAKDLVSVGTLNASVIHAREIFKSAIKNSAHSVILVHNHPSGNTKTSSEDVKITEEIKKAGELLGIKVLDHIIIGNGSYKSLELE